jgi:hypothetical protein
MAGIVAAHDTEKLVLDSIGDGNRISDKIMRECNDTRGRGS